MGGINDTDARNIRLKDCDEDLALNTLGDVIEGVIDSNSLARTCHVTVVNVID